MATFKIRMLSVGEGEDMGTFSLFCLCAVQRRCLRLSTMLSEVKEPLAVRCIIRASSISHPATLNPKISLNPKP